MRPRRSSRPRARKGVTLVQKPLFGAQGEGLRLIETVGDLAPDEEVNGAYYLQEFIPQGGRRLSRLAHLRLGRAASSPP